MQQIVIVAMCMGADLCFVFQLLRSIGSVPVLPRVLIVFLVLISIAAFTASLYMYFQDKRRKHNTPSKEHGDGVRRG